jgi:PAS domain S-box-containing protein
MSVESITVLHVDDEPDFIDLASTFIERENEDITIETETDPRQCLEHLKLQCEDVDCIVSDYDMPHLDGLQMLQAVREIYPDFPFILFTGKGSEEIAAEAISQGVNDYMQKEMGTDQYKVLANRIRQHVRRVRTEQALRNSEAKYRAMVEQNIVGIYLITTDEFSYVNPRLADIFGYEQEEVIGRSPLDLVADEDKGLVEENLRKRVEGEVDTIRYRFTGLRNDGDGFPVLAQGRAIKLNGEQAVAGVLLDLAHIDPT